MNEGFYQAVHENVPERGTPVNWFRNLWQSINGKDSWAANPWVWAISFRQLPAEVVAEQVAKAGAE